MKTMKNPAASCLYFLHLFVLAVSGGEVTGSVSDTLTLPCTYIIHTSQHPFCWGRGGCSLRGCNNYIIRTDGQKVTWRKSDRYQLLGNINQGDVSLTITGATNEDEGTYCCRVEIPGLFNDIKEEVNVKIQEAGKTTTETANSKQTDYDTSSVSGNLVTLTTQMIFLSTQETITPEQSKSPDATTYVIAGVFGALFLVTLMGGSIYMCKTRSRKQTKTESTMSVINMEALAETGNDAMENIYT